MIHYISMIVGVVVTSCYLFPFILAAFPIANSKMIMAATGIAIFAFRIYKRESASDVDRSFITLTLWSLAVSFVAWLSTVINGTHDYTFATYFVSMWVWIGGGFTLVTYIRKVHGKVSVELLVNYMMAVCVVQCALAMFFDANAAADSWRLRTFVGEAYMGVIDDRLSGIGCALDTAGLRFAAVLIMSAFMTIKAARHQRYGLVTLYLGAMLSVTVVGNMMARTTSVGAAIAFAVLVAYTVFTSDSRTRKGLLSRFVTLALAAIVLSSVLYRVDDSFRGNLRFGFEGFFSLVEKGEWETHSNNILKSMIVWPDDIETWIIGDGYIENPLDKTLDTYDPYYIGPSFAGYYMQTDIGYCRYIFYFGIVGLGIFCVYFCEVAHILACRFQFYRWMFYLLLVMNFIGWCKMSSDIFMVFAPFLCISAKDEEYANENSVLPLLGL